MPKPNRKPMPTFLVLVDRLLQIAREMNPRGVRHLAHLDSTSASPNPWLAALEEGDKGVMSW